MAQQNSKQAIKVAYTATVKQGMAVMDAMRNKGLSRIWVDMADAGKTVTAKEYQRRNPAVVAYVDGSQHKTLSAFIREVARAFGVDADGRLKDVFQRTVQYLRTLDKPMLIVDEAGDLSYNAFLELKAYWNAVNNDLEYNCSFLLIGAQCLEAKLIRLKALHKVGYEEIIRRFGDLFIKFWPRDDAARAIMFRAHAEQIVQLNAPEIPIAEILEPAKYEKEQGYKQIRSLTRVTDNIFKLKK